MATKKQIDSWIRAVEKRMEAVGKERDKLDDAICSMNELKETCEDAYDSLQRARDALSELV